MATISTNRLSLVEYSPNEAGYIRSLASLSGICVNKIEAENAFEVTLDGISTDGYLSYFRNFTNGFTLFVRLSDKENMVVIPSKKYDLRLKGSDEREFTSVGTVSISKKTRFLSNDVLIMHQIDDGTFIICNRYLELPYLSSSAHASNKVYTVLGIGATTNSSKFLRSDGTWQTPSNTTYTTLATNAHASGTNYVVNGPGDSTNTFLRGDGSWQTLSDTTYATLANNAHASGTSYLVNGIGSTTNAKEFLRNDGTWQIPIDTTYATLGTNAHATNTSYVVNGSGYSGTGNGTKFLREDGTWHTPTNTTYGTFTTAANGLVPKPTAATATTNYVLAGNGTWVTMSGGGSVQQAWGMYGNAGTPVQGISMPTSQNRSRFPIVNTKYDGAAAVTSVLFPTNEKELIALPVEISKDGVIYVPVSSAFGRALEKLGYELVEEK